MSDSQLPSEKRIITVWVQTDRVGSKVEMKMEEYAEDWADMDDHEKDAAVFEFIVTTSMFEWGWCE